MQEIPVEKAERKKRAFYRPKVDSQSIQRSARFKRLDFTRVLTKSILAGVLFSMGATVYLCTDSRYLGAVLFSIGLFAIFSYGFSLFTCKVGYLVVQDSAKNLQLPVIWLGNLLGSMAMGYLLKLTRLSTKLTVRATELCDTKLADNALSILLLSFFCGLLLFIAADGFKNAANAVQKYIAVILPVMVMLLAGFEHGVSNIFFFTVSGTWSVKAIWYLLIMTVGNALGAVLIPLCHHFVQATRGE